jgi:acetyl esterase/lipase
MPWALFTAGVLFALMTIPALVRVHHWALLFPAFVVSWFGTGMSGWWLTLIPTTAVVLVALGGLAAWPGWIGLALIVASIAGLLYQSRMARRGSATFDAVLHPLDGRHDPRTRRSNRSVVLPFLMHDRRVARVKNIHYADGARRRHTLDVYMPRSGVEGAPVLLQIHGGAWMIGTKDTQGRPLMNALVDAGWVCVAINYRLSPRVKFPDHLVDCKLALAWIREHIAEYGGDPSRVVVTGGSAGGHLTTMMGLTANDPRYQPGFEEVDTSVLACVPMYGAYDLEQIFGAFPGRVARRVGSWMGKLVIGRGIDDPEPYREASPVYHVASAGPPFLVVHGTIDNLVPVEQARRLVAELHDAGTEVAYVELEGAPHAFDVFHSTWAHDAVAGIVRYLTWILGNDPKATLSGADSSATDPMTTARTAPS